MKIFLSWSGQLSHSVALLLKRWLPSVLQYVDEPFVSSKDIEKGTAWFGDISKRLNESDFGIICLTSENLKSEWIHFEAGAIANKFQGSRIPGLLVNVRHSDVEPPLSQFQLTNLANSWCKIREKIRVWFLDSLSSMRSRCPNDGFHSQAFGPFDAH